MKRKKPSREDLLSSCSDIGPEDGADPRIFFRKKSNTGVNRKALQLCSQVAQALSYVLSWETSDVLINSLTVESVLPAPNSAHLLITVSVPGEAAADEVMQRLQKHLGRLRAEVAHSIHRKRVPELSFRVVARGEVRP